MAATVRQADSLEAPSETPTAEGYLHELGIYSSDDEFRALICPFAFGGLEAGDPVVFAYDPHKMELLHHWLPDAPSITYVTDTSPYATPARALAGWRRLVEERLAAGAQRVRIAGNVPHPGYGRPYAGWDRYEAAIDRALGDLPVWAPCLYDGRITPPEVLETAGRRHRRLLDPDGTQRTNDSFVPVRSLAEFLSAPPDPLEDATPVFELIDPMPHAVRAAVREAAGGVVGADKVDDLVLAVTEAVTNARIHGVPPVSVRMWLGGDRVVVNVHDEGSGPGDPFAGLLPSGDDDAESGRGLWLAHQLDIDLAMIAGDGFTVRFRAGSGLD